MVLSTRFCYIKVSVQVPECACKCAQTLKKPYLMTVSLSKMGGKKIFLIKGSNLREPAQSYLIFCSPLHSLFLLCADLVSQTRVGALIHRGLSKVERQCCLAVSVAREEASFVIDILSLSSALAFCQLLIVYTCIFSIHKGFYKFLSVRCHSTSFPLVIGTP